MELQEWVGRAGSTLDAVDHCRDWLWGVYRHARDAEKYGETQTYEQWRRDKEEWKRYSLDLLEMAAHLVALDEPDIPPHLKTDKPPHPMDDIPF